MIYSQKVKKAMKKLKLKNVDVYSHLGMTPPTFAERLKSNRWWSDEIEKLNKLLKIEQ